MRKRSTLRTRLLALPCLVVAIVPGARAAQASESPVTASGELSNKIADRARGDLARIQLLVKEGSLPKSSLEQAETRLADINDEAILSETLYGSVEPAELTPERQQTMLGAAERRVERQAALVRDRRKLLEMGIIARAEMNSVDAELETRQHVLDLARNRVRLIEAQRQMAQEEQNLEQALESRRTMSKFAGCGRFSQADFEAIAAEFERQFHYPLPVTARGQTPLHESLGLDHHGKVDVGLNPEEPAGIWLRRLLEDRQIPYIAFRAAVPGAATAPHIHLGTGSSRIGLTQR
jgi:hypothetical protein